MVSFATNFYEKQERWGQELGTTSQRRIQDTLDLIPSEVRTILDACSG